MFREQEPVSGYWLHPGSSQYRCQIYDSMQLIDEENDMTIFFDIIDDVVHPFEVSAKASASDYIH